MSNQTVTFTPPTRQERLDLWTAQARVCEREQRPDLARICWSYVDALTRGDGRIDWEALA